MLSRLCCLCGVALFHTACIAKLYLFVLLASAYRLIQQRDVDPEQPDNLHCVPYGTHNQECGFNQRRTVQLLRGKASKFTLPVAECCSGTLTHARMSHLL